MFMDEARSLTYIGAPERISWKSLPGTNTSLLRKYVNYAQKNSFITLAPVANIINFLWP